MPGSCGLGFRVWGLGFRVWVLYGKENGNYRDYRVYIGIILGYIGVIFRGLGFRI